MAENHSINIPAHHNIYNGVSGRELRIEFSLPEKETNENTGIAILVPGFGGNIDSNVYKKMREEFADTYNLVTVQCDYFGSEFMQGAASFNLTGDINNLFSLLTDEEKNTLNSDYSNLFEMFATRDIMIPVVAKIAETEDHFNDMGYMQSIDIITAIEAVRIMLKENKVKFNEKYVVGYGHSHGAYLLHLSNCLAPHLFSHIIDNSAWMEPGYLNENRRLFQPYGQMILQIDFEYLAGKYINDKRALNLNILYDSFDNTTKIISFQGSDDHLINHNEKEALIKSIPHTDFILMEEKDVDGLIFKSNKHGLDAEFLKAFDYGVEKLGHHENSAEGKLVYEVLLSETKIKVDYFSGLPIFSKEVVFK
ncbi:DUF2920 family protein [Psychrobacillus sp.]|uniref:DUF2920 family protein n=1 Tax=Psychrobacillus sp. TaxID=1871623 RepID=UPI0028BDF354|nr:DUF2920 family protein [Psychrobacillus sp.]